MDVYQIIKIHNKMWSEKEIACFIVVVLVTIVLLKKAMFEKKIKFVQAGAILLMIVVLAIIFGSTVFERETTTRQYELLPFWSWKAIFTNHDTTLLLGNILNCIILLPVGILLPFIVGKIVKIKWAALYGFSISATIELCQLVFRRGLFEWDDMIHNTIGCIVGCLIVNEIWKKWSDRKK